MSRTIRRKNCYLKSAFVDTPDEVSNWDLKRYNCNTPEEVINKQIARFHRCSHPGDWRPPHYFERLLNRRIKAQNKQELIRCLKIEEWDDHLPIKFRRDSGWMWW